MNEQVDGALKNAGVRFAYYQTYKVSTGGEIQRRPFGVI
jgi:hypothetical protein